MDFTCFLCEETLNRDCEHSGLGGWGRTPSRPRLRFRGADLTRDAVSAQGVRRTRPTRSDTATSARRTVVVRARAGDVSVTEGHWCRRAGSPVVAACVGCVGSRGDDAGRSRGGELGGGEAERGRTRSENQPRAVSRACSPRPFIRGVSIDSSRLPASERHTGAARTKSHCPRVLSSLAEPRELSGERAGV